MNTPTPIPTPKQKRFVKLREVCQRDGLKVEDIIAPCKEHRLMSARHGVWLELWVDTDWRISEAARTVRRHHATFIYGVRKAAERLYGTHPKASLAEIRQSVQAARDGRMAA